MSKCDSNACEDQTLSSLRIAIVGLGLMGGSLGLALREHCKAILACDRDQNVLKMARKLKIAEKISSNPLDILPEADVVVLATPVQSIISLIRDLPKMHPGSPIILDLGSTKEEICRALASLPSRFDPIGGHPMCGKEKLGLANAEITLFKGATFAFSPIPRTSLKAIEFANQLATAIGAKSFWIDPETHDRWVAATSHLPYILSAALALSTPHDSAPLIGPGFRSVTRLASTSDSMMLDILKTNRNNIIEALRVFKKELSSLERLMQLNDFDGLREKLIDGTILLKRLLAFGAKEI